jgi:tryptophan-rich sensory protein
MRTAMWKVYGLFILLTEAVGALSGFLTKDGTKAY